MLKSVSIALDDGELLMIDAAARSHDMSRSAFVRAACQQMIKGLVETGAAQTLLQAQHDRDRAALLGEG